MPRQQNYGDGTLYKRKDGRFEFKIRVGERGDGSPAYKSFYSRDKTGRKAKAAYRTWLEEKDREKVEHHQTVRTWAEIWLRDYKQGKGSAGNYKNYKLYVEKHILPHIGALYMEDVRQLHIEQLYSEEQHLSNSALNYIKLCLRGIFKSGMKNRLCLEDPSEDVTPPAHEKKEPLYFSLEEVRTIKAFAAGDPDGAPALALLYTGCRISELCAAAWDDYQDGVLHICKAATRTDEAGMKYSIADTTKSKRPRDVVLNADGQTFFNALPRDGPYLFTGAGGRFMNPDLYRRRYYAFLDRLNAEAGPGAAPVRRLSPHKARHTYATILLESCKNLRTVQAQLGHSVIAMTQRYAHTDTSIRKLDVDKLKY